MFLPLPITVQFSHSVVSNSVWHHGLQHTGPPCPSRAPRVCSNSCPPSRWCHPTISSSVVLFPPAVNLSQCQGLFQWVSSSHQVAKVLELQLWYQSFQRIFRIDFLYDWLVFISLQSKVLSRVFSKNRIRKHKFFGTQPSLCSNDHIYTWLLEKPQPWLDGPVLTKWCLCFLTCHLS